MLVSIIIPTYNRLELLKRAISSVLKQTYQNFELIVVDDASTDETVKWLRSKDIHVVVHSHKQGVSSARNSGIQASKGEFIAFLDSDDVWEADKLKNQLAFHKEYPEIVASYGSERWFRDEIEVVLPKKYRPMAEVRFEDLLHFTFIGPSSVMVSRNIFESIGYFDETMHVCEDFDLWLRIAKKYRFVWIPEVMIHKHTGDYSQLSKQHTLDKQRIEALLKHYDRKEAVDVAHKKLQFVYKGAIKHENCHLKMWCEDIFKCIKLYQRHFL